MANLSVTYPDFIAGTTIVSGQVDQNNADIVNYINARNTASASWDAISTAGAFTSSYANASALLVSAAQSGGILGALISNTSNTASSDSKFGLTVAGTSAGDPYITFAITSGTTWSIGGDNSDSDRFKVSKAATLGTSDYIIIDPTTTAVSIAGTNTNDSAATGYVGERVVASATVNMVTGSFTTITSIILSAGDWDISFVVFGAAAASAVELNIGVATATNTSTGWINGDNTVLFPVSATFDGSGSVGGYRVQPTGSTTYYLTGKSFGATIPATARISARRAR